MQLRFTSPAADLASGGSRDLTVRVEDANDNLVAGDSGRTITFAKTSGSGSVSGLGTATTVSGTASKTVTGSLAGTVTVTASAAGLSSQVTTFTIVAGTATHLVFTSSTAALASGSTRDLAVELRDANENPTAADSSVTFTKTGGSGSVAGLGTSAASGAIATRTVTGQGAGPITISASAGGLTASTSFEIVPGAAAASTTTISAAPSSVAADGSSISTITVRAKDASGNTLKSSGGPVTLSASAGTLSAVTDNNDGTYAATLRSSSFPGQAVIGGTIAGGAIAHPATVTFLAQCVVPNVRGLTLAAARAALRRAHCSSGTVKRVASRAVRAGRVISQQPGKGRRLPDGSTVKLVVSSGPRRHR